MKYGDYHAAHQITYDYFCALGGLNNPRTYKLEHRNGTYVYYTYHLRDK